jgi:hypothetical protein
MLFFTCSCIALEYKIEQNYYQYNDDVKNKIINISYTNNKKWPICIPRTSWPNKGRFSAPRGIAYLHIEGKKHPNFGFDIGPCQEKEEKCVYKINQGQTVSNYIIYDEFQIDEKDFEKPKVLYAKFPAYRCE